MQSNSNLQAQEKEKGEKQRKDTKGKILVNTCRIHVSKVTLVFGSLKNQIPWLLLFN